MTVRKMVKKKMLKNLQAGKKYGRGMDFWHYTKQDIDSGKCRSSERPRK